MNEPIVWSATIALVLGLLTFDFYAHVRRPHEPTFRESVRWTAFYVGLALAFGASMWWWRGEAASKEFLAGYITEWSLSVDNLFVFLVILSRFAVPPIYRQRVLLFGVALALVLRGLFIALGATALAHFSWVFYGFGALLIYTAIALARDGGEAAPEYKENRAMRAVQRWLPSTDNYRGGAVTVVEAGRRLVTPMLLVMIAIGTTDVLFALDSIPAIFGLTTDPYIVFAANAFALMGLRQLFFVVDGLLSKLIYLSYGLAVVLGFIGVKLVFEALLQNSLPFINGGEAVELVPHISIEMSLAVILGTLAIAASASLLVSRSRAKRRATASTHDAG